MNFPKTPDVAQFRDTLATLKRGDQGLIDAIADSDPMVQRLMTLGLVEGAVVERGHSAFGGDPTEFRVHGLGISLRREQARCFSVCEVTDS